MAGRQGWSERGHQLHLRLSSPEDCGRSWALRAVQLCLCTRCSTGSPEKLLSALAYWEVKKLSLVNIFPAFCSISSHIFKFSTGNTLSTFETDWLVYLVEAFTGAKASFLTLTALGSSEPQLLKTSFPSEAKSSPPSSAAEMSFTVSVPAVSNMELSPTSAISLAALATFQEPQIEHLPLAHGDGNLQTVDALKQPGSAALQQLPEEVILLRFHNI